MWCRSVFPEEPPTDSFINGIGPARWRGLDRLAYTEVLVVFLGIGMPRFIPVLVAEELVPQHPCVP